MERGSGKPAPGRRRRLLVATRGSLVVAIALAAVSVGRADDVSNVQTVPAPQLTQDQLARLQTVSAWDLTYTSTVSYSVQGSTSAGSLTHTTSWTYDVHATLRPKGGGDTACRFPAPTLPDLICAVSYRDPATVQLTTYHDHVERITQHAGGCGASRDQPGSDQFVSDTVDSGSLSLDGSAGHGAYDFGVGFGIDTRLGNPPVAKAELGVDSPVGTTSITGSDCVTGPFSSQRSYGGTPASRLGADFYSQIDGCCEGGDTQVRMDNGAFVITGVADWTSGVSECILAGLTSCPQAQLATGTLHEHDEWTVREHPRFELRAIEVTQALQDWRNSVPLTEGKMTYVRAYLDWTGEGTRATTALLYGTRAGAPLPGSPLHPLNGTIAAASDSDAHRATWQDSLDFLLPSSWTTGSVDLEVKLPDGAPAPLKCLEAASVPDDCQASVQFQPVGELQVKLFRTQWSATIATPHPDQPPPGTYTFTSTFDDVVQQVDILRALLPSASVDWTTGFLPIELTGHDRVADDALMAFIDDTNAKLAAMRVLDGCLAHCTRIYAALIRNDVNGLLTLGLEGASSAVPGSEATIAIDPDPLGGARNMLAHEIGHDLGLIHDVTSQLPAYHKPDGTVPTDVYGDPYRQGACGEVAGADSAGVPQTTLYPFFAPVVGTESDLYDGDPPITPGLRPEFGDPAAGADDRLFGLDSSLVAAHPANAVFDPSTTYDLMSYCPSTNAAAPNGWQMGRPTYLAARDALNARFPPSPAPRVLARARRQSGPASYLVVRGTIDLATNAVTFAPFESLTTSGAPPASTGAYTARLLDAQGNLISEVPFSLDLGHADPAPGHTPPPANPNGTFLVLVPSTANAARLEVLDAGDIVGSVTASPHSPAVTLTAPVAGSTLDGATADVRWTASDADGDPLSYTVQYSADGGATWSTLALDVAGTELAVDATQLAGSTDARLRVIASDGFNTAQDTSGVLTVPNHAPRLSVSSPDSGAEYATDQAIPLTADAYDTEDGPLTGSAVHWTIDGNDVGSGNVAVVEAADLANGTHTIRATATDSAGASAVVTREISIGTASAPVPTDTSAAGVATGPTTPQGSAQAPPAASAAPTAHVLPLTVVASVGPQHVHAAAMFTLTQVVTNTSADAETGVVLTEAVAGTVTVTPSQGTCTVQPVVCYLGTLAGGASASVTTTAVAGAPGAYVADATVSDEFGTTRSASLIVDVLPNAPPQLSFGGGAFAPPLVARRVGRAAVLSTTFHIDEPAAVLVHILGPRNAAPVPLLRGSFVATVQLSRPGNTLRGTVDAGTSTLHLRLHLADLRRAAVYRIQIEATDAQGLRSTLALPFRRG